jgi:penicillin amidase
MLGITPGRWTPAVVISRHQALTSNVSDEVRRCARSRPSNLEQVRELMHFQGGNPRFELDPAIDPQTASRRCARAVHGVPRERAVQAGRHRAGVPRHRPASSSRGELARSAAPGSAGPRDLDADPRDIGSNNWVVSGSRTLSTQPIMANDPHRVIAAPSLR